MKYLLLAIGFTIMNLNEVVGSQLLSTEENAQIGNTIFRKANHKNFNISNLAPEEKEWIYETELLTSLKSLEEKGLLESEDGSNLLTELATYYSYKKRPEFAKDLYIKRATLDLASALRGDETLLGIFNNLIKHQLLEGVFFNEIIDEYRKDPDNFARGSSQKLIEDSRFKDSVLLLAEAYKASSQETLNTRIKQGVNPIPLYDNVLALCLKKLNKDNH